MYIVEVKFQEIACLGKAYNNQATPCLPFADMNPFLSNTMFFLLDAIYF
jgi:hypothetical protein